MVQVALALATLIPTWLSANAIRAVICSHDPGCTLSLVMYSGSSSPPPAATGSSFQAIIGEFQTRIDAHELKERTCALHDSAAGGCSAGSHGVATLVQVSFARTRICCPQATTSNAAVVADWLVSALQRCWGARTTSHPNSVETASAADRTCCGSVSTRVASAAVSDKRIASGLAMPLWSCSRSVAATPNAPQRSYATLRVSDARRDSVPAVVTFRGLVGALATAATVGGWLPASPQPTASQSVAPWTAESTAGSPAFLRLGEPASTAARGRT